MDAQVGGKIAQVGSRLIDMTAKKMADIFFGKFSELISRETPEVKKDKFNLDKENKKTQSEKKYIYIIAVTIVGAAAIVMFLIN